VDGRVVSSDVVSGDLRSPCTTFWEWSYSSSCVILHTLQVFYVAVPGSDPSWMRILQVLVTVFLQNKNNKWGIFYWITKFLYISGYSWERNIILYCIHTYIIVPLQLLFMIKYEYLNNIGLLKFFLSVKFPYLKHSVTSANICIHPIGTSWIILHWV
jgi:hypothetical protein